jgi:hypothetical protein
VHRAAQILGNAAAETAAVVRRRFGAASMVWSGPWRAIAPAQTS